MKKLIAALSIIVFLYFCVLPGGCSFSVRVQEPDKPKPLKAALGRDILYLDKGEEIPGRLECIREDGTYIFTGLDENTQEYPADKVLRVEFQRKLPDDDKKEASEISDSILQEALKKEISTEIYPNAAYVTIYDSVKIKIEKDLSVTLTRRTIRKVLTRRGLWIANNYVDYLADRAKAEIIFARTITKEGKLKHVDESAIEDGSRFGQYPQYDNARRLKWSLKEVNIDSYTDCSYKIEFKPASMLAPLYETVFLQSTEPIIHCEVLVETAPGAQAIVTPLKTEGNERISQFKQSDSEGTKYGVVSNDMPRLEPENMMPPYADILPRVIVSLKDSWEQIATHYNKELNKSLPKKGRLNPAIIKAHELAEGKETELEKARALYNFAARDIGFLVIPPDEYSFIPHKPVEILAAGQANALDKAFLLHAMLRSVGVNSAPLLAHRRDAGQLPEENACLWPMNTPVVRIVADGETYYCYPTTQVIPFGYVPAGVQGSTAIAIKEKNKGLTEIPMLPASMEGMDTESEIELYPDGRITVKRRENPRGGSEVSWRGWSKLKPEELKQKFESIVATIHPKAKLLDYSPKSPKELANLDKPVVIEYRYEVEDYALTAGGKLLVFKLPELDYSASAIEKYERDLPLFWGSRYSLKNKVTIKLPKGFTVKNAPGEFKSFEGEQKPFMWYSATSKLEAIMRDASGNIYLEIHFSDIFERSGVYEPADKYDIFIKTIKVRAELAKQWLVIEKIENDK